MSNIWKEIGNFFKKVVSGTTEQAAIDKLGNLFQDALQNTKEKNPELAQSIVKTLAAWLPYLAESAKKTSNDIDDKVVAELQEQIVAFDNTPDNA